MRFAQPLLVAITFVVLWWLEDLTVESALLVSTLGAGLILAVGMARSIGSLGIGRFDLHLGLRSAWFGVRGQGSLVAANVTARLDVAMLPAFVASASVGLYSVATNISLIVYQLSNTFAGLVLPSAARDPERGPFKVIGSLWASLARGGPPGAGPRGLRASPCWASSTETTSATPPSPCASSSPERCSSPERRS